MEQLEYPISMIAIRIDRNIALYALFTKSSYNFSFIQGAIFHFTSIG